eukprot:Rhum_TRINITY_DN13555_c0_g1::Rhum_TRINITY_DN13555_c0_g1_i1::g.60900::m.60900
MGGPGGTGQLDHTTLRRVLRRHLCPAKLTKDLYTKKVGSAAFVLLTEEELAAFGAADPWTVKRLRRFQAALREPGGPERFLAKGVPPHLQRAAAALDEFYVAHKPGHVPGAAAAVVDDYADTMSLLREALKKKYGGVAGADLSFADTIVDEAKAYSDENAAAARRLEALLERTRSPDAGQGAAMVHSHLDDPRGLYDYLSLAHSQKDLEFLARWGGFYQPPPDPEPPKPRTPPPATPPPASPPAAATEETGVVAAAQAADTSAEAAEAAAAAAAAAALGEEEKQRQREELLRQERDRESEYGSPPVAAAATTASPQTFSPPPPPLTPPPPPPPPQAASAAEEAAADAEAARRRDEQRLLLAGALEGELDKERGRREYEAETRLRQAEHERWLQQRDSARKQADSKRSRREVLRELQRQRRTEEVRDRAKWELPLAEGKAKLREMEEALKGKEEREQEQQDYLKELYFEQKLLQARYDKKRRGHADKATMYFRDESGSPSRGMRKVLEQQRQTARNLEGHLSEADAEIATLRDHLRLAEFELEKTTDMLDGVRHQLLGEARGMRAALPPPPPQQQQQQQQPRVQHAAPSPPMPPRSSPVAAEASGPHGPPSFAQPFAQPPSLPQHESAASQASPQQQQQQQQQQQGYQQGVLSSPAGGGAPVVYLNPVHLWPNALLGSPQAVGHVHSAECTCRPHTTVQNKKKKKKRSQQHGERYPLAGSTMLDGMALMPHPTVRPQRNRILVDVDAPPPLIHTLL